MLRLDYVSCILTYLDGFDWEKTMARLGRCGRK